MVVGTQGVQFGTGQNQVGAHQVVVTGMIPQGALGRANIQIVQHVGGLTGNLTLHDLGQLTANQMNVPAAALQGAASTDWVPFRVTGNLGRTRSRLSGPTGHGSEIFGAHDEDLRQVRFTIELTPSQNPVAGEENLPTESPSTGVLVPVYHFLPDVTVGGANNLTISFAGAVEASGVGTSTPQTITVHLLDGDGFGNPADPLEDVSLQVSHPQVVWNGLLIAYSGSVTLIINGSSHVAGALGSSDEDEAEIYQELEVSPGNTLHSENEVTVP